MASLSRRAGKALLPDGEELVLYEALRPIACHDCRREIAPGERFTRRLRKGGGYRQFPVCAGCSPFRESPSTA